MMGDPISDHDGVRCCPAMRENSDEKYIVKIISVPSSQRQLDALLLTGAYPDAASATEYFRQQADGIIKEAEVLKELSKLQGFVPYEGWQVVPMDGDRLGYEVYLLSPYRRTLEKYLKSHTMTHLGAVNLALDLCAALSICRRAGFMFIDLKPSNIFLMGDREYRIGDLGFTLIDKLKFNSLPSKYRSPYTAQELHDDLATLNPTADIYSVGMILYQIYNEGQLPFEAQAPSTALPTPLNADYEMAEIIHKAIDPNPRKRWQTPIEMGQALVSYMQRNQVNDIPIVPPTVGHDVAGDVAQDAAVNTPRVQGHGELAFMQALASDETAPDALSGDDLIGGQTSAEVSDMLAQADELLARQMPDLVIVHEAPEIRLPEPEEAEAVAPAEPEPETLKQPPVLTREAEDEDNDLIAPQKPQVKKKWIATLVLLLVLALACYGGLRFYQDYYLLPIEGMQIDGKEDTISVFLRTEIDETLLTVVCTDTYGNTLTTPVVDGHAEFIGLTPGTMYKITVEVDGFHALTGVEPCSYTTAEQTKISGFTAKTGTEDGSVVLDFSVDGRQTQDWMIEYTAEDEEPKSVSFTGHTVTINGLSVGKTYTFDLVAPAEELWILGDTSVQYTASKILLAQNLTITGCVDGVLTAQWELPADIAVDSWTVRCYSDAGYDETIITSGTSAAFEGIEADRAYTVEVTADGMTQNVRAYVSANPATVTKINVEASQEDDSLHIGWEFEGTAPDGGWLLLYTIDGSDTHAVISCQEPSAVIAHRIPGANYEFTIQAADGSTVFRGRSKYSSLETAPFAGHGVKAKDISASLLPTPEDPNWSHESIKDEDYTSKHQPGSKVSMMIYSSERPDASNEEVNVLFVIRDDQGGVVMELVNHAAFTWNKLFPNRSRYCTLDIPAIPKLPGQYSVEVYFNNRLLVEKSLTVLEAE